MENANKVYEDIIEHLSISNKSYKYLADDDPLNILIKLVALSSIINTSYIDKIVNNKYPSMYNYIDEKSSLDIISNFGVKSFISPASLTINIRVNRLFSEFIKIPYNTKFKILNDTFVTFRDYYISPNNSFVNVKAYLGTLYEEEYSISNIVDQGIELSYNNVSVDNIEVSIDDTKCKYMSYSRYSKEKYVFDLEYNYRGSYSIVFSKNYDEYILSRSRINVKYISTNTIKYDPTQEEVTISSTIYDNYNNIINNDLSVYNIESFSYGDSRHTPEFCVKYLGRYLSSFRKMITTEDYKVLTDYYPGVAISAAYDINSPRRLDPLIYIQIPYYVKVVIAPTENYYPTEFLKNELYEYYDNNGVNRNQIYVQIIDPRYRLVNVKVLVHSKYMTDDEILNSYNMIYNEIKNFFAVGNLEFGSTITESLLLSVVLKSNEYLSKSDGIEIYDFITVNCEADELPILGELSILFNYDKVLVDDILYISDKPSGLIRYSIDEISITEHELVGPIVKDRVYSVENIYKDLELGIDVAIKRTTNFVIRSEVSKKVNYVITELSNLSVSDSYTILDSMSISY